MAQGKKYKLGELEFETEQEYREAAADLKRIKGLVDKYNVEDPEQAKKILASIQAHPDTFRSPYGRKFVAKLQKAAGLATTAAASAGAGDDKAAAKRAKKEEKEKRKREKQLAKSESRKADGGQKENFRFLHRVILRSVL